MKYFHLYHYNINGHLGVTVMSPNARQVGTVTRPNVIQH